MKENGESGGVGVGVGVGVGDSTGVGVGDVDGDSTGVGFGEGDGNPSAYDAKLWWGNKLGQRDGFGPGPALTSFVLEKISVLE